jgi:hypothetical protein
MGIMEIGYSKLFNSLWPVTQVANLDLSGNVVFEQNFQGNSDGTLTGSPTASSPFSPSSPSSPSGPVYNLTLSYAAKESVPLNGSIGVVYWNYVMVGYLAPTSYGIFKLSTSVVPLPGNNTLTFTSFGVIDIDNVSLSTN